MMTFIHAILHRLNMNCCLSMRKNTQESGTIFMANCHSSLLPFFLFIVQKILKKNLNFSYHRVKNQNKMELLLSILKVEILNVFILPCFFTGLILRFVWNNFSTKISKSGHSVLAKNRKILQHKKSHMFVLQLVNLVI